MLFALFLVFVHSAAVQPVDNPFDRKYQSVKHFTLFILYIVLKFDIKGRIRLLRELGRHWSILTGEECFKIFDENLIVLTESVDQVRLDDKDAAKSTQKCELIIY